jgi:hypothetical protein
VVEWRREEGGEGLQSCASHVPRPNHAGRKKGFFFLASLLKSTQLDLASYFLEAHDVMTGYMLYY